MNPPAPLWEYAFGFEFDSVSITARTSAGSTRCRSPASRTSFSTPSRPISIAGRLRPEKEDSAGRQMLVRAFDAGSLADTGGFAFLKKIPPAAAERFRIYAAAP